MEAKFSLEEKLTQIRSIVDKMQKGMSDYDKQVELFENGARLIQECRQYLDQAEMQVQQLVEGKLRPVDPVK
ncbi:MAG: exodeoxyribonuclease VII small subunit [Bacteroidetes bacterium]|jgi:exodeoxyribonuclease VII small subunit|nr:MAG: exodeoxyribonuclease VII small subunit [Bacteroidota bacterium]